MTAAAVAADAALLHARQTPLASLAADAAKKAFLDSAAVYRPRRELQKAAPRNFDAFFAKGQKKTVEIPAVRALTLLVF